MCRQSITQIDFVSDVGKCYFLEADSLFSGCFHWKAIRSGSESRAMSFSVGLAICITRFVGMLVWEVLRRLCIGPKWAERYRR